MFNHLNFSLSAQIESYKYFWWVFVINYVCSLQYSILVKRENQQHATNLM